jgi:hypothetical protein
MVGLVVVWFFCLLCGFGCGLICEFHCGFDLCDFFFFIGFVCIGVGLGRLWKKEIWGRRERKFDGKERENSNSK